MSERVELSKELQAELGISHATVSKKKEKKPRMVKKRVDKAAEKKRLKILEKKRKKVWTEKIYWELESNNIEDNGLFERLRKSQTLGKRWK